MLPAPKPTPQTGIERLAVSLANWVWLGLLANLIAILLLVNFGLPAILPAPATRFVAYSLLWTGLAVQAFLCWRYGLEARPPLNVSLVVMASLIGTFQTALLFGAGLVFGFDRLPGNLEILTLMGNLVSVGTMLVGIEISRAYLVALFHQRHLWLALPLLSLLFSLVSVPFARFEGLDSAASFFQAAGEALLPIFCQNLLASFLALLGGPLASLAYRAPLLAFEWLSPAQPDQKWVVMALLSSLIPILALPVIRWQFLRQPVRENTQTDRTRSPAVWARVWMRITPLVTGGVGGIARTLRGRKPKRVAEVPLNPQGR